MGLSQTYNFWDAAAIKEKLEEKLLWSKLNAADDDGAERVVEGNGVPVLK